MKKSQKETIQASGLVAGFVYFYEVRKTFGILLFSGTTKKENQKGVFVRGNLF